MNMRVIKRISIILLAITGILIGGFFIGFIATSGDYAVHPTVAEDPNLPSLTIGNVTFHSETYGDPDNPLVIVIHGGPGGDYRSLLPIKALGDEYFVLFYDQRGTGLSPRVDADEITIESTIGDLDSIVDHYSKSQPVHLIGHSWGAMVASYYIGKYPDKVDKVVLAEPGFLTPEGASVYMEKTKLGFSFPLLGHFLKVKFQSLHVDNGDSHSQSDFFTRQWGLYEGPDHPLAGYRCNGAPPSSESSWRNGSVASRALIKDALDEKGNFVATFIEGVDDFEKEVLFLTGSCQTLIGEEWQREQMEYFPIAEIFVIPDAGHSMFQDNTEASLKAVRQYFEEAE